MLISKGQATRNSARFLGCVVATGAPLGRSCDSTATVRPLPLGWVSDVRSRDPLAFAAEM